MNTSTHKKLTMFLLCWFLGLFGVHRLYTGHHWTGLGQLFALILFGILALLDAGLITAVPLVGLAISIIVDAALILMGRFTDRNGLRIVRWV